MAAAPVDRMSPGPPPQATSPEPAETPPDDIANEETHRPEPGAPAKAAPPRPRSLDEVFGDVLPDVTRDERGHRRDSLADADYLGDVPPHHT